MGEPRALVDEVVSRMSSLRLATDVKRAEYVIEGIRAYDAAQPGPREVAVPETSLNWWSIEIYKRDNGQRFEADIWLEDDEETILSGEGPSANEALAAALAQGDTNERT